MDDMLVMLVNPNSTAKQNSDCITQIIMLSRQFTVILCVATHWCPSLRTFLVKGGEGSQKNQNYRLIKRKVSLQG